MAADFADCGFFLQIWKAVFFFEFPALFLNWTCPGMQARPLQARPLAACPGVYTKP